MRRTRFVWLRLLMALFLMVAMTAAAVGDEWKDESRGKARKEHKAKQRPKGKDREHRGNDGYFHERGYTTLGVPPGHLPPPGQCRLWYPDRPPGHQPPPENCGRLRYHAPVDAWLIHRPKGKPKYVDVSVYDAYRPGIVITVGIFDMHTGAFIRYVHPQ
ncbi:MAG TPA: hypothetical protein VLK82_23355 [Candidatus Tectomicrobia bacterium]|nr:hypothetical protein [Candidatus Tectomicrobia bacterium]